MKRLLTHLGLRFFLLFSCIFLSSFFISLSAQEFVKGGANGFEWRLIGRVFFDGGYFFNDTTDLGSSFQVNDIRLGTQIRFLEHWEAKIELGYGDNKISMKDIFLTYKFGENGICIDLTHAYQTDAIKYIKRRFGFSEKAVTLNDEFSFYDQCCFG